MSYIIPHKFPKNLTQRIQKIFPDQFESIFEAFSSERFGSFRLNTLKDTSDVWHEFSLKNIIVTPFMHWDGVYIFDRQYEYVIKGTDAFYSGKIYLQSLASMIPVIALDPKQNESILDVCAAPGSKTTQIAMMQGDTGQITALEKNPIRADKLAYNCRLQWATNVKIIRTDAGRFLHKFAASTFSLKSKNNKKSENLYDKILLDAPCSAEGRIFLGNEKTFGFWSEENITRKARLQNSLLEGAWECLRVGGVLVYSTCTLAVEENEALIASFLHRHADADIVQVTTRCEEEIWQIPNLSTIDGQDFSILEWKGVRILPSRFTEWFFVVKLVKID